MLPPCLLALQRSWLTQLGGTVATEAFVGLIFHLDPAVKFVCQCVKPIDLDHWSNSSQFLLPSTRSVDRLYTFGHSMHID